MQPAPDDHGEPSVLDALDPESATTFWRRAELLTKNWFRAEVHGLEHVPNGAALIVSNHSGGTVSVDMPVLAAAWLERFGASRPLYLLADDAIFLPKVGDALRRVGIVPASPENANAILRSGAATIVFPGGAFDAYRTSRERNKIVFAGRVGYVRTALAADAPIVPVVSIGGHENQLYLIRGDRLAQSRLLAPITRRTRAKIVPITIGFPFGLSFLPLPNLHLPSKIVTRVLEPIDVRARFGDDPDLHEVDALVRRRMQAALDELAAARRFPIIG